MAFAMFTPYRFWSPIEDDDDGDAHKGSQPFVLAIC